MTADERDWESLSDLWRDSSQEVDRTLLRRMVASYRRRLAAVVIGEILVVAWFAWLSWISVRDGVAVWEAVWLSTLWSFTAVAAPFAWWNRRGSWQALGQTVAEFQRQRAARRMRSLRFSCGLFLAEILVVWAQLAWFGRFTAFVAAILGALTVAFGAWAFWMRKRAAREVAMAGDHETAGHAIEPDGL
jgi:hypothetical protein